MSMAGVLLHPSLPWDAGMELPLFEPLQIIFMEGKGGTATHARAPKHQPGSDMRHFSSYFIGQIVWSHLTSKAVGKYNLPCACKTEYWVNNTNEYHTDQKEAERLIRGLYYSNSGKRWEQLRPGSLKRSVRKQMQKIFWRQRQDLLMDWMWNNHNHLTVDLFWCRLNEVMYTKFLHNTRHTVSLNNGDYYCCSSRLKRCLQ